MDDTAHRALLRRASSDVWVRNMLQGRNKLARWLPVQSGGGEVEAAGYRFLYDEEDGGDTLLCISRPPVRATCFRVWFDREAQQISLDVSYHARCAQNKELAKGDGTVAMLSAIVKVVLARPDIASYRCMVVTDNSTIEVPDGGGEPLKLPLMDVFFMCTGCTWYSSLAPMFLRDAGVDAQYREDRDKRGQCTWDAFIDRLPSRVAAVVEAHIEFGEAATRLLPAVSILERIRAGRTHAFLFHYTPDFLAALGVRSLRGTEWVLPLQDGDVPVPTGDDLASCRHPTRGWVVPADRIKAVSAAEYDRIKRYIQTSARAVVGAASVSVVRM